MINPVPGTRPIDVIESVGTLIIALIILLGAGYLILTLPTNDAVIALVSAQVGAVVAFFFTNQNAARQGRNLIATAAAASTPPPSAPPAANPPPNPATPPLVTP